MVKDGQIHTALFDAQTGALVDTFLADGDDGHEDDCRPSPERASACARARANTYWTERREMASLPNASMPLRICG